MDVKPTNKIIFSSPSEETFIARSEGGARLVEQQTGDLGAKVNKSQRASVEVKDIPLSDRIVNLPVGSGNQVLTVPERLSQCGSELMNAVLEKNHTEAEAAIEDLNTLSQNELPEVKIAVAAEVSVLSRVRKVWEEYKSELLAIWDRLYHSVDARVSKAVRALSERGIGPADKCSQEVAKNFAEYARLNAYAGRGVREITVGIERNPKNDYYELPEGYFIAQSFDLPDQIAIRELNEKLAIGGGFKYSEETGLIKTAEGLKAMLFIGPDGKAVLSFSGTEGRLGTRLARGMVANIQQNIFGGVPLIYEQAKTLVELMHQKYGDKLVLTGFSQGGALAQYAGLSVSKNISINCMNSAGLEVGVLNRLIEKNDDISTVAASNVVHTYLQGELVNLLLAGGTGGIYLGQVYEVPAPQPIEGQGAWSSYESHDLRNLYYSLKARSSQP